MMLSIPKIDDKIGNECAIDSNPSVIGLPEMISTPAIIGSNPAIANV